MDSNTIMSAIPVAVKVLVLVGILMYLVMAFIIVRQEQLMSRVFSGASEPIVRFLAILHLIMTIVVLVLAIILL